MRERLLPPQTIIRLFEKIQEKCSKKSAHETPTRLDQSQGQVRVSAVRTPRQGLLRKHEHRATRRNLLPRTGIYSAALLLPSTQQTRRGGVYHASCVCPACVFLHTFVCTKWSDFYTLTTIETSKQS